MLLNIILGIAGAFVFSVVMATIIVYGILLSENMGKGIRHSISKSTREILWAFRLRKTMD